jgi:hypothetical protein
VAQKQEGGSERYAREQLAAVEQYGEPEDRNVAEEVQAGGIEQDQEQNDRTDGDGEDATGACEGVRSLGGWAERMKAGERTVASRVREKKKLGSKVRVSRAIDGVATGKARSGSIYGRP